MLTGIMTGLGAIGDLNYLVSFLVQSGGSSTELWGLDLSIEGLRSQRFSRWIFGFLIASLIVFAAIIYLYLPRGKDKAPLKRGEKVMFGAIIFGMVMAVVLGWIQLIEGYLV